MKVKRSPPWYNVDSRRALIAYSVFGVPGPVA